MSKRERTEAERRLIEVAIAYDLHCAGQGTARDLQLAVKAVLDERRDPRDVFIEEIRELVTHFEAYAYNWRILDPGKHEAWSQAQMKLLVMLAKLDATRKEKP